MSENPDTVSPGESESISPSPEPRSWCPAHRGVGGQSAEREAAGHSAERGAEGQLGAEGLPDASHTRGAGLAMRVASAAVGIPLFLGFMWWGVIPFGIAVLMVAAIGLAEMLTAYRRAGIHPNLMLAACGLLPVVYPLALDPPEGVEVAQIEGWLIWFGLGLVAAAPVWEVVRAARTGEISIGRNIAFGALCGGYAALFCSLTWLRMANRSSGAVNYEAPSPHWEWMLVTVLCVWAMDTFALFTGKAFGKHKLAPKLSPGKTLEGAIGGAAAALVVGAGFGAWLLRDWRLGLAIGAAAGIWGQVGDLFKSGLKREIGIKDFGGILPGHGGVLDRFDSLLFTCPLVIVLLEIWR